MRQRRVTGIEERLAPYADLILRGVEVAPAGTDRRGSVSDCAAIRTEAGVRCHTEDGSMGAGQHSAIPGCHAPVGSHGSGSGAIRTEAGVRCSLTSAAHCSVPKARAHGGDSFRDIPAPPVTHGIEPYAYPLRWYERPSPRYALPGGYGRVYVELGCGRGRFVNGMAAADPDALYIGAEGCKTILIRALAGTRGAGHENVRYIDGFVNDAASAFAEDSLDGIFLNFSDPWPKIRHAGRRLTAPAKAEAYFKALRPGGFVALKTDGEGFFEYSLAVFGGAGFHIDYQTRDLQRMEGLSGLGFLHIGDASCFCDDYVIDVAERGAGMLTEYEQKFRASGLPIYCFIAIKQ